MAWEPWDSTSATWGRKELLDSQLYRQLDVAAMAVGMKVAVAEGCPCDLCLYWMPDIWPSIFILTKPLESLKGAISLYIGIIMAFFPGHYKCMAL